MPMCCEVTLIPVEVKKSSREKNSWKYFEGNILFYKQCILPRGETGNKVPFVVFFVFKST
jgi:hypothetical protein